MDYQVVKRTRRDPFSSSEALKSSYRTESRLQKVQSQGRTLQHAASVRDEKMEGATVTAKIAQEKWEISGKFSSFRM